MARRPNYGFEKRQREIRKQKKKAEKLERKRQEDEASAETPGEGASDDDGTESDPADRD